MEIGLSLIGKGNPQVSAKMQFSIYTTKRMTFFVVDISVCYTHALKYWSTRIYSVPFAVQGIGRNERNAHNKNSVVRGYLQGWEKCLSPSTASIWLDQPFLSTMEIPLTKRNSFTCISLASGSLTLQKEHYVCFSLNKNPLKHSV